MKMKKIIQIIETVVQEGFEKAGYDKKYAKVTLSNRPDLCEFQCNGAMAAAKAYHKAPFEIAGDVLPFIQESDTFASVDVVKPGFINIKIAEQFLTEYVNEMAKTEKFGCTDLGQNQTIVIDYGGPNVAKPLHIGHLRPAIIGESIKRIKKFSGYHVIGDVHLGDWGYQMGLIIEALKEKHPDIFTAQSLEEVGVDVSELEQIYPAASARAKEDTEFAERAHHATYLLQNQDPDYYGLWQKIIEISVNDLKKNYEKLDVNFELWKGESDAQPYIPAMVDKMVADGYAYKSDGALVVDVTQESDKKEIPPCIIIKSDGAALYSTTDLATLVQRKEDYNPVQVIYVVDKRQEMHFTQVFRTAKKTGIIDDATELIFVGFGTMNGKDGKPFKTREGGVMRLEKLIADTNEAIYQKISERDEISEEEARDISAKVGLSAIKYGDLSNQAAKDYIFDIERFCEFEGNTGPYILYTMVRIHSILRKCNLTEDLASYGYQMLPAHSPSEHELQLKLTNLIEVVEQACKENAPHKICQYLYEIANSFNSFYHNNNILKEQDAQVQKSYLALIMFTYRILEQGIDLLGFTAPDKM
jgi:arginyl-tRNA synthetase